jgi:diguanylate cyclase (GGDEF)-like protein
MTDRTELLEAALDSFPEGVALLDLEGRVILWNRAAEVMTGYASVNLVARPFPGELTPLSLGVENRGEVEPGPWPPPGRGALVRARHKLGHDLSAIARNLVLRDGLGGRIGTAVVFHPAESLDALPHGESSEDSGVETSQTELEERLELAFEDFTQGAPPFGLLWITVDQAHELRKTHGAGACQSMLEKVERVLANGLRSGEAMGRWGDDEFLVLSHEHTAEMLSNHAQALAGLSRTAEFRWWGDRVSLTVSIGAAQANRKETLAELLGRAKNAMFSSLHAGGNHITSAPGEHTCLPS